MTHLAQRLGLDLADPLAGDPEIPFPLPPACGRGRRQSPNRSFKTFSSRGVRRVQHFPSAVLSATVNAAACSAGVGRVVVRDKIAQTVLSLFLANGRLQRNRLLRDLQNLAHLFFVVIPRDSLASSTCSGSAIKRLRTSWSSLAGHADEFIDGLHHVHRYADGTRHGRRSHG